MGDNIKMVLKHLGRMVWIDSYDNCQAAVNNIMSLVIVDGGIMGLGIADGGIMGLEIADGGIMGLGIVDGGIMGLGTAADGLYEISLFEF
jgi:hypothetical protein